MRSLDPCPKCRDKGGDTRGDNLIVYPDGSAHCFACQYHIFPKHYLTPVKHHGNENKAVLPSDFSREVPAKGWKWLLQYGLPYSYWKPHIGYSETYDRLIFTIGNPIKFSIGRSLSGEAGERKWKIFGDRGRYVEILGEKNPGPIALVEDIISAHKVSQITACIPLFGTFISNEVLHILKALKRPVRLWLDKDQYPLLPLKLNRLQTFLEAPVTYITTEKDPKRYSLEEIGGILNETG